MFNHHDINRDACMLHGPLAHHGYDWWWHSFTAQPFFIEFFICNPALGGDEPVLGQLPANRAAGKQPSYLMVKAGTWGTDHCQLHRFFARKAVFLPLCSRADGRGRARPRPARDCRQRTQ